MSLLVKTIPVLQMNTSSFATVKRWTVKFKRNHANLIDDEHSERPTTATTTELTSKKFTK